MLNVIRFSKKNNPVLIKCGWDMTCHVPATTNHKITIHNHEQGFQLKTAYNNLNHSQIPEFKVILT
jgi:hypothetical protein